MDTVRAVPRVTCRDDDGLGGGRGHFLWRTVNISKDSLLLPWLELIHVSTEAQISDRRSEISSMRLTIFSVFTLSWFRNHEEYLLELFFGFKEWLKRKPMRSQSVCVIFCHSILKFKSMFPITLFRILDLYPENFMHHFITMWMSCTHMPSVWIWPYKWSCHTESGGSESPIYPATPNSVELSIIQEHSWDSRYGSWFLSLLRWFPQRH